MQFPRRVYFCKTTRSGHARSAARPHNQSQRRGIRALAAMNHDSRPHPQPAPQAPSLWRERARLCTCGVVVLAGLALAAKTLLVGHSTAIASPEAHNPASRVVDANLEAARRRGVFVIARDARIGRSAIRARGARVRVSTPRASSPSRATREAGPVTGSTPSDDGPGSGTARPATGGTRAPAPDNPQPPPATVAVPTVPTTPSVPSLPAVEVPSLPTTPTLPPVPSVPAVPDLTP